jgi:hypothetical protein
MVLPVVDQLTDFIVTLDLWKSFRREALLNSVLD